MALRIVQAWSERKTTTRQAPAPERALPHCDCTSRSSAVEGKISTSMLDVIHRLFFLLRRGICAGCRQHNKQPRPTTNSVEQVSSTWFWIRSNSDFEKCYSLLLLPHFGGLVLEIPQNVRKRVWWFCVIMLFLLRLFCQICGFSHWFWWKIVGIWPNIENMSYISRSCIYIFFKRHINSFREKHFWVLFLTRTSTGFLFSSPDLERPRTT